MHKVVGGSLANKPVSAMLMLLENKLVRAILEHLTVPTSLAFFLDRDDPMPSPGALLAACDRVRRLRPYLEEAGGEIGTVDPGFIIFTRVNVFLADTYAVLAPASKAFAATINPMMLELGSLQPHIPANGHTRSDGARIYMHFRDVLIVEWRRLVTNRFLTTP